jgi:hypothetical protein
MDVPSTIRNNTDHNLPQKVIELATQNLSEDKI